MANGSGETTMIVWHLLDSRTMGGIERHVLVLCGALRSAGHDARIVLLHDHGPHVLADLATAAAIPLDHAGGLRGLVAAARHHRCDLLHTHGYKAGLLGRIVARGAGLPVVSTFHNGDDGDGRLRLYTAADRACGRLAEQIAVSAEIAGRLSGDVHLVPNFVDVAATPPIPAIAGKPLRVGFVGRLVEDKGIDTFCHLARGFPDLDWQVFGDGPLRLAMETGSPGMAFHGMVADMDSRWSSIDLLVMPSRREGLPMAALESMARGIPVLAYAVGGLPGLITNDGDGWLVAPGDEPGLARQLRRIVALGRRELNATGHRAWRTVLDRFGTAAGLARVLAVYARAVSRQAPQRRPGAVPQEAVAFCSAATRSASHDSSAPR